MGEYLEKRSDKTISSNSLCSLASIVLKNNYFEYVELKYHQKRAFAIGTTFAPLYSNLLMAGLEKKIFQISQFEPFLWLEYLYEIFFIWIQCSQKLNRHFNCINSLLPTIKFTMDYSATIDKLETYLYCKPNDTHQHFQAKSCHHDVYKRSIAYRQLVRFKRFYSIEEKLNNRLDYLKQWLVWLVNHGYKEDQVDSETERVKLVKRTVSF